MFLGFIQQEDTLYADILARNSSQSPVNLDSLPTYRVYGPDGLMDLGTGSLTLADSGSITGASDASPIVVTSSNHGLTTGQQVTITGVTGNTNANGTFTVTVVDGSHFSLNGSSGNAAYVSGGTWNTTGLYTVGIGALGAQGYSAGTTYSVLIIGAISSVAWADLHSFCVG